MKLAFATLLLAGRVYAQACCPEGCVVCSPIPTVTMTVTVTPTNTTTPTVTVTQTPTVTTTATSTVTTTPIATPTITPVGAITDDYGKAVLEDHPVGYWRLDEVSPTGSATPAPNGTILKDSSGRNHPATITAPDFLLGQPDLIVKPTP